MKTLKYNIVLGLIIALCSLNLTSCEGDLEPEVFDQFSSSSFFQNASDAKAAVTAVYTGMLPGWQGGYASAMNSYRFQQSGLTDELVVSWGGSWKQWTLLNYEAFRGNIEAHYGNNITKVTECTIVMEKLKNLANIDDALREQYIAEMKALRAHYSYLLYTYYGPVSIVVDYEKASDPNSKPDPRPSEEWMKQQIIKDYEEAAAVLPERFTGDDYGRYSAAACKMGLLKLYLKQKEWDEAIIIGKQIEKMGFSLVDDYKDIFTNDNEQNNEIILASPCDMNAWPSTNGWLAHVLPGDYRSLTGKKMTQWGGYKMPWKTYNKFDLNDERLDVLVADYPTDGGVTKRDALGAIPIKYGEDPAATGWQHGVDLIIFRYADVLLSLAEAINEVDGPSDEAFSYVNQVRNRAGLESYDLNDFGDKDAFRGMILDERLFELWCECVRRDDLIRHGKYIQRAIDDGSPHAQPHMVLFPLPQKAIDESEGAIQQNPGY
ncbi:MAG: RagB/SusD family nutrient uptake outer membrane protein [Carboxylicivirga sp.]|jgi:hypothetical protein|nr:RagB/SusD family nutrient uptake outer membrane protein [Carboxylicivirga sp.]